MAITAWSAKVFKKRNLFIAERFDLAAINRDRSDQFVLSEHGHMQDGARAAKLYRRDRRGLTLSIRCPC